MPFETKSSHHSCFWITGNPETIPACFWITGNPETIPAIEKNQPTGDRVLGSSCYSSGTAGKGH
jgi:hypothetical protein